MVMVLVLWGSPEDEAEETSVHLRDHDRRARPVVQRVREIVEPEGGEHDHLSGQK